MLPCYNPQPAWVERVVSQYAALQSTLATEIEIVLVNDGSTTEVADEDISNLRQVIPLFQYISYTQNRGKGHALRQGVAKASAPIVLYTDIDFPYSVDSIAAVYHCLQNEQADVAAGVKNNEYYAKVPPMRRYISKILRGMIGIFFSLPVTDTQCGLKGFNLKGKQVFLDTRIDRYLFDLEFIHAAHKKGLEIMPIKVALNDFVVFRQMNYSLLFSEVVNFIKIVAGKK